MAGQIPSVPGAVATKLLSQFDVHTHEIWTHLRVKFEIHVYSTDGEVTIDRHTEISRSHGKLSVNSQQSPQIISICVEVLIQFICMTT